MKTDPPPLDIVALIVVKEGKREIRMEMRGATPELRLAHLADEVKKLQLRWEAYRLRVPSDLWQFLKRAARAAQASENASVPRRKDITKRAIVAFRESYAVREGSQYGWMKAAIKHFQADEKTLRKKLAE